MSTTAQSARRYDATESIDFPAFSYADALSAGLAVVAEGNERQLPIAVTITFGEQTVFHAALPGTSADNDHWLSRKIRVVNRYGSASLAIVERFASGGVDPRVIPGFDPEILPASGGAVPIRVQGSLVGAIAVSGLTDVEDHDLAMRALATVLAP